MKTVMMYRLSALLVLSSALLSACGGDAPPASDAAPIASLTATAEIETGVNTARMTIIPNDVAPWLSQIILISTERELYQTALDSGKAKPLNMRAKDALGLMRVQAAGVVLTISETGKLSAMVESNDAGDLSPLPVSAPPLTLSTFCHGGTAPTDTLWALSETGERIEMAVLVEEAQIRLSELSRMDANPKATDCMMVGGAPEVMVGLNNQSATLDGDSVSYSLMPQAPEANIMLGSEDLVGPIAIGSGLSTPGLSVSNAALVSNDSIGSVFRDGVIILSDADAQRLVLIDKPFALRTLADAEKP